MSNQNSSMKQELQQKFDMYFLANFLFFNNNWTPPAEFFNWTIKQRRIYQRNIQSQSVEPTKSNQWIWFGAFAGAGNAPRFNNEAVPRMLYGALIQPLDGGNLRSYFSSNRADVNPYKYFPKTNRMSRAGLMQAFKDLTDGNPEEILKEKDKAKYLKEFQEAMKEATEYFAPDLCDTKQKMREVLSYSYPQIIIDQVINSGNFAFKE